MFLEPGQLFASRYRVLRCIAEGGMGAIFEAEHTTIERRVALKLLYPHIMSLASARKKFELEARISARVNSPHIVEVLDAGFDEPTKSPFLVMELLEGQTLAEHIYEQGPLGPREALRLLQQVAAGLDAAHAYRDPDGTPKPIVHRDLKPENLFLARSRDAVISAKILDYGIAKMLGDTANLSQEVRGTPLFMAFEQITAGSLSAQTDIWAFGLIAFYMLAGAPYWRSVEGEGISVQSLFAEILMLPLELPSVRLREQGNGIELPPAFDAWLLRCINRDPSQRFPTVTAAVEALARAFDVALVDLSAPSVRLVTTTDETPDASGSLAVGEPPSADSVPVMAAPQQRSVPASRVPPGAPWHRVAAGVVGGSLLLGIIARLVADDGTTPYATPMPAHELPATAARPADPRASADAPSASGSPRATAEASAAPLVSDRRTEAPTPAPDAPTLLLGGVPSEAEDPSTPDSRAPSHDQDENPTSAGESSDARPPSRTRKPSKRKRKPRRGSSEAYRVR